MNKKGFTLIELLAVIVIISVIAIITIPIITETIDKVKTSSYKESLRSIFTATDLYLASTEFFDFPEEGINVVDSNIQIKNKDFTSGKIIKNEEGKLELEKVSNDIYCGSGTLEELVVIKGSCDQLDTTPPTLNVSTNTITSNSITIVASGEDLESGIKGYQFSKDNGTTWTSMQTSNVYTFNNLTDNTTYSVKVRVYNNNDLATISDTLTIITVDILEPTYSLDVTGWSQSKVVTITYPEREVNYVYEYSLDEALTWIEVESPALTKDIVFTENGTIIARILDGTNEISGNVFEVTNIDTTNPTVAYSMNGNTTYAKDRATIVSVSDDESGASSNLKYLWNTSTTEPSQSGFTTTFTNGDIIYTPVGVTGGYYLWMLGIDNAGNSIITRSNVFNLDNTVPVITINGSTSITITETSNYVDGGAIALDNINGDISSNISVTNNVNTSIPGTYTVNYDVSDLSGNASVTKTRTVIVRSLEVAYNSIEQTVLSSVQNYTLTHSSVLPTIEGDTTEVTLTTLKNSGYINDIEDPVDLNINCNGYILITKMDSSNYKYIPHIKCGDANNIGNSITDGLIAHYTFDDFQEPTENLLPDVVNDIIFKEEGSWYSYSGTTAIITQGVEVSEWNTNKATKVKLTGGTSTLRYLTQGILALPLNEIYTVQVKIKNIGSNSVVFSAQYGNKITIGPSEIKDINVMAVGNGTSNLQMRFESKTIGVELEFIAYQPQIEKKSYATPFTESTRSGIIKDYSMNDNKIILGLDTTPRWIKENDSDYYLFDGLDDTIVIPDFGLTQNVFTYSMWLKPDVNSSDFPMILTPHSNGFDQYLRYYNSLNKIYLGVAETSDLNQRGWFSSDNSVINEQWSHIAFSINQNNIKLYVNGNLVVEKTETIPIGLWSGNWYLGQRGLNTYYYNGDIDDVRIYKRDLSADEIKYLYATTK